jgi:hypothetical protein
MIVRVWVKPLWTSKDLAYTAKWIILRCGDISYFENCKRFSNIENVSQRASFFFFFCVLLVYLAA